MGCAVFVIGPAGCGKTTMCQVLRDYYAGQKRRTTLVNLDPAQMHEDLEFSIDIRDHIELADIMEEADFGPNGGLMAGMEAISDNIDVLGLPEEEDFLIFDCPGQIELYIHSDSIKKIVTEMQKHHTVGIIYVLDATHTLDVHKFVSGALSAMIAMAKFEVPHLNVLTKCDLVPEEDVEEFLFGLDIENVCNKMEASSLKEKQFNTALATIISDNGLLGFMPLDYSKEETIEAIAYNIDTCTQYFDTQEGGGAAE
ncbi:hypothetical protein NEDG_01766 [Nematocida displodere]|uniref:GPN-loop GTPase 3 n=1 Tax=Nematocida displodere TaxID=1805483 RepID=A0A177EDZ2_9MICR|nr:hypothetical protein NEDG_01766 [Nematocida displodere]